MCAQQTSSNWNRSYFTQAGEENLLFFIAYGKALGEMNIQSDEYRITSMPEGLSITTHQLDTNPEQLNMFREGMFEGLLQSQHPELLEQVKTLDHCYIVQAVLPDQANLDNLKAVIGIVTYLLDSGAVAVLDPAAYYWWTPEEWRNKVFEPEAFDPYAHVKVYSLPEKNESSWVFTHGMRKFGRPDLSIHYVNEEEMGIVREMINRFIAFMAQGGMIEEGQEIEMHDLPEGMICRHKNSINDPQFNNNHVEIFWPELDKV